MYHARDYTDYTLLGAEAIAESNSVAVRKQSSLAGGLSTHAFAARSKEEGVLYDVGIDKYLEEYREEATGTQSISDLEEKVIKIIPAQTEALQKKLAYHWQNFKVSESGVPLSIVTNDAWLCGTKAATSSVAASSLQVGGSSDQWT